MTKWFYVLWFLFVSCTVHPQDAGSISAEKSACSAPSWRLWTIGDSLTEGLAQYYSTPGGYRTRLFKDLMPARVTSGEAPCGVDMAGGRTSNNPSPLAGMDPHHSGRGGKRVDEIEAFIVGDYDHIMNHAHQGGQPTHVLLHAGTNDAFQNYNLSTVQARLESLLDEINTEAGIDYADMYVAKIVPACNSTSLQNRINTVNAAIDNLDTSRGVNLVDMSSLLTCPDDYAEDFSPDGVEAVHPNECGYNKMADAWDGAI